MPVFKRELWQKPDSPSEENEEFDSAALSGWDRNYSVSATAIDATAKFTYDGGVGREDARESVHEFRRSWILVQPPSNGAGTTLPYNLSKQFSGGGALPDGLYLARFGCQPARSDCEVGIHFVLAADDSGDLSEDDKIELGWQSNGLNVEAAARVTEDGALESSDETDQESVSWQNFQYFAIIKNDAQYDCYISPDGVLWVMLLAVTYSGEDPTRVGWRMVTSIDDNPITPIYRIDFFRYFSEGHLP